MTDQPMDLNPAVDPEQVPEPPAPKTCPCGDPVGKHSTAEPFKSIGDHAGICAGHGQEVRKPAPKTCPETGWEFDEEGEWKAPWKDQERVFCECDHHAMNHSEHPERPAYCSDQCGCKAFRFSYRLDEHGIRCDREGMWMATDLHNVHCLPMCECQYGSAFHSQAAPHAHLPGNCPAYRPKKEEKVVPDQTPPEIMEASSMTAAMLRSEALLNKPPEPQAPNPKETEMSQDEMGQVEKSNDPCPSCGNSGFHNEPKFIKKFARRGRRVYVCDALRCGYTESEPFPPKRISEKQMMGHLDSMTRKPLPTRIKRGAFSRLRWLGAGVVLHATPLWDRMAEGTGELVEWVIRLAGMV